MIIQSSSDKQEPNKIGHYIKRNEIQSHRGVPIPTREMYVLAVPMRHTPYAWVFEVLQFVTEQIKKVILCIAYGEEGFLFGNVVDYCILIGVFARW